MSTKIETSGSRQMPPLLESQIKAYAVDGIIKIHLPSEIVALQNEFLVDSCKFLKYWANFETTPEKLPYDLVELAKKDREVVGKLYKVSKRFPASRKLSCHPFFLGVAKQLLNTDLISCYHLSIVRIDLPDEEVFLMPAHQDFPYIQGSPNGITVYMAMHNLTPEHGVVSYKKGTQNLGILKVVEGGQQRMPKPSDNKNKTIATSDKVCEIADFSPINHFQYEKENINKEEAFVFHTLLLHRSERNTSKSARITMQIRFDDLTNKESFNRNFPEGRSKDDLLSYSYPEYVVSND